jgi:tetratricopeptide (TPR) repeat protein
MRVFFEGRKMSIPSMPIIAGASPLGVRMRSRLLGLLVIPALLALSACASGGSPKATASEEMKAGVKAAARGYWQEALFRFERAHALTPDDGKVLNNMAVALEVAGRYEDALATYKLALEKEPSNHSLKKNYSRFAEFYTSYARGEKPKEDAHASR